jgi:hypothetical protein
MLITIATSPAYVCQAVIVDGNAGLKSCVSSWRKAIMTIYLNVLMQIFKGEVIYPGYITMTSKDMSRTLPKNSCSFRLIPLCFSRY